VSTEDAGSDAGSVSSLSVHQSLRSVFDSLSAVRARLCERSTPTRAPAPFWSAIGMGSEDVTLSSRLHRYSQSEAAAPGVFRAAPSPMAYLSLATLPARGGENTGLGVLSLVSALLNDHMWLGGLHYMDLLIYIESYAMIAMGVYLRHDTWLDRAPH